MSKLLFSLDLNPLHIYFYDYLWIVMADHF